MNKALTTFVGVVIWLSGAGQTPMTINDAMKEALSKNYNIQISQNNVEMTANLATKGHAGLLPTVSASGALDYGNDNIRIEILGQPGVTETKGAQSLNTNASVAGSFTIYSGRANAHTYKQLVTNSDLSNAQSKLEVESIVMQVITAYYNVLRTQDNYDALAETFELSKERLALSVKQKELSGGKKINVLSAKVDLNKDSVNLISATQSYEEAQINFNQLLGRDPATAVVLTKEALPVTTENYEALKAAMLKQNWEMQSAKLNQQVSMLDYYIAKSAYLPKLDLGASYGYNRSDAEGSILKLNESNGLGVTLSLSIPIYSGGTRKKSVQNAQLQMQSRELQIKNTELALDANLLTAYKNYERAIAIVKMEEQNLNLNEENINYTKNQYKLGLASSTQYREAQINLLLTKNNLNNVRYNLKLAELELLRLSGALVKAT
jgi:outer membrane protein